MPLKRHKKYGQFIPGSESIEIERLGRKESFKISHINSLKIKLMGFNGQPFHKHMDHLRPQDMDEKKLVHGLGNYVRFNYKVNNYKYELYFEEEGEYEEFKKMAASWKENYPDIGLDVQR